MSKIPKFSMSSLKLPHVISDGQNYTEWHQSLLNEAGGNGHGVYLKKEIADVICGLEDMKTLIMMKLQGEVTPENQAKFNLAVEVALKNEQALTLVNATIHQDCKKVTKGAKLADDVVECMRKYWQQSTVTNHEILSAMLNGLCLEEGGNSVSFLLKCDFLKQFYLLFLEQDSFTFKQSLATSLNGQDFSNIWISDSACSAFITCHHDWLTDFESTFKCVKPLTVT